MTDATAATSVRPFRIEIPRADVGYPYDRLASARWPGELPGVGWARGVPADYLRELAGHWRTETQLNSCPQFTAAIDGQADGHDRQLRHS